MIVAGLDLDKQNQNPSHAKPCARPSCGREGTRRIDCLVNGISVRITAYACSQCYNVAQRKWIENRAPKDVLFAWFRGRV
jgi:hypothetical protein